MLGFRAPRRAARFAAMPAPLALVCSVPLEADPVRRRMSGAVERRIGGRPVSVGRLGPAEVLLVTCGMGKTNAAQALTAVLESLRVRAVVGFGVAGAYPGSTLRIGDAAIATSEVYADEGVSTPDGWTSTESIGIPLATVGGVDLFNAFPVDPELVATARAALSAAGIPALAGTFATVSCCSGTEARGREIADRFGAVCESMEGAAYAHVAALYATPFLEVRGVSNAVEDRDLTRWRLDQAAEAAAAALVAVTGVI